ncbi:brachyurin-like [Diabrotica undecimpunctata]|uniref:brachyurin-like n=1 Tax=Diabrotica undecimpunctata TaxID=50387 RepID=UPI003B63FD21
MYNYYSVYVVLVSSCIYLSNAGEPSLENSEKSSNLGIIDGQEVVPHSMPYMAAIRTEINYTTVLCGGSLISDSLVLTAARCVYGASEVEVTLGAHNLTDNEDSQVTLTSTSFVIHEDYKHSGVLHDIAVIELPKAVTLNDNIATVKLPELTDISKSYEELEASVAGWGRVNDAEQINSDVLLYQNFTIIPNIMCELSYLFQIQSNQLCTSGVSGKNICLGDNGSPLVLNGVQIGIASYGSVFGCSMGFPGVFTRVTSYLGWLML